MFSFLHRRHNQIIEEQAGRITRLEAEAAKVRQERDKLDLQLYHLRLLTHVAIDLDALKELLKADLTEADPAIIGAWWSNRTGRTQ